MKNNIPRADLEAVIEFLRQDDPILTHSRQVREFEAEWSAWLGVNHSVFVNSGASANLLTISALREVYGPGEILVPTLTWVSDIAAVIQCGFKPIFVDINPRTLGMHNEQVIEKITPQTKAVFLTHVLGYNALSQRLLDELAARNIPLLEDVCESYGATFGSRKLGTFGLMSNFSFYYAHHMSCAPHTPIPYLDRDGNFKIEPIKSIYALRAPDEIKIMAFDQDFTINFITPSHIIKHKRRGKQMLRLQLRNNRQVDITEDHSVFLWDAEEMTLRTVKGSTLKKGDFVAAPRRLPQPGQVSVLNFLDHCYQHAPERFFVRDFARDNLRNVVGGWRTKAARQRWNYAIWGAMPLSRVTDGSGPLKIGIRQQKKEGYIPAVIPVSPALARFIGFFVAEGSYMPYGVTFSFHIDETAYINDILETGKQVFGLQGVVRQTPESHSAQVQFQSAVLKIFLLEYLGVPRGAKQKRIPPTVFHFDSACQCAFLYGLFRSDGKGTVEDGRISLTSGSQELLNDVSYLCAMLGMTGAVGQRVKPGCTSVIRGRRVHSSGVSAFSLGRLDFSQDGNVLTVTRAKKGLPEAGYTVPRSQTLHTVLNQHKCWGNPHYKTVSLQLLKRSVPAIFEELPALDRLYHGDLCLLEVTSVQAIEPDYDDVYDIAVPGLENFIGGSQPICLHNSTIEGGMISTNDSKLYEILRMFRSHGMVRESTSEEFKRSYREKYPDLNPDFIFAFPAYNMRPTEIGAVIGRSQLQRLDAGNRVRVKNLNLFLQNLDPAKYQTDFETAGSCNYAFTLILKRPDPALCEHVMQTLRQHAVEFRRGTAGGGNQLRQPYLQGIVGEHEYEKYPQVDHIHFYGFYIGNYPSLEEGKILELCAILNELPG